MEGFQLLQRISNMFAKSSLVPKNFQGNLPDCAIAVNMAQRLNADPLMVMQNLYVGVLNSLSPYLTSAAGIRRFIMK